MNYEKLTVERFAVRLKEGAYKGLTGARRAIGKTDWTKKEKDRAHELADSHFAAGGKSSAKAPVKSAPKVAPKAAAKKTAAKAAPAPKRAAKAAATPKASPRVVSAKRAPVAAAAPVVSERVPHPVVPPGPPVLEEVTRQNSASAVIAAYRNSGELNHLEQRAYDIATVEYAENASKAAKRIVCTAAEGIPTPSPLEPEVDESEELFVDGGVVTAPEGAQRIAVPNGEGQALTPEEQAQYERLQRGAAAIPAILGHS